MLEDLSVNIDARRRGIERRRAQIEQARCTGSYQDNAPGDIVRSHLTREHFPGRNVGRRVDMTKLDVDSSVGVRWDLYVADLDVIDARIATKRCLAAGIGRLHDISACALGYTQHFRGERRYVLIADPVKQEYATDNLVAVGQPVNRADSMCRSI